MEPITIAVVSNGNRLDLLMRFVDSIIRTTNLGIHTLAIYENGETPPEFDIKATLIETFPKLDRIDPSHFVYHRINKAQGLAAVWNRAVERSRTRLVLLCNDDCIASLGWEGEFQNFYKYHQDRVAFLLCQPNGFSAFVIDKEFWYKVPFNNEFPAGYYEDDDFFLSTAVFYGLHTKKEVMSSVIFSWYDTYGTGLFTHLGSTSHVGWNKRDNLGTFLKNWDCVPACTEGAYENKNGQWFKPTKILTNRLGLTSTDIL